MTAEMSEQLLASLGNTVRVTQTPIPKTILTNATSIGGCRLRAGASLHWPPEPDQTGGVPSGQPRAGH